MTSVYILSVFMLDINSYAMLPIKNNPYPTFTACMLVRNVINKRKLVQIGPYKFRARSARCLKKRNRVVKPSK